jgi:hypothetical protein
MTAMEHSSSGAGQSQWTSSSWLWLAGILVVGMVLRAVILWATEPVIWPDSNGYLYLAQGIVRGDISRDVGMRTPTYPLLIILAGNNINRTVFFQSLMGLAITALIFWITWMITQSNMIAGLTSLLYALDVNQIQFEISILTETITVFLLLMSIALLILAWKKMDEKVTPSGLFWAIGLVSGLTLLARPLYNFLPVVLFLATLFKAFVLKLGKLRIVIILVPATLLVLGWSTLNYWRLGYFGFTTLIGFTLTDITGNYFELAPQEFSQIRDIYLAYRPAQIAIFHPATGTQWASIHELARETGLSVVEISKAYTKMSLYLIFRHPDFFANIAWLSWVNHWRPHILQHWPIVISSFSRFEQLRGLAWMIETPIHQALNYLFLLLSYGVFIGLVLLQPKQVMEWVAKDQRLILVTIGSIVIFSALFSTLSSFGEPRYSIPIRPLIPIVLFSTALFVIKCWQRSRRSAIVG